MAETIKKKIQKEIFINKLLNSLINDWFKKIVNSKVVEDLLPEEFIRIASFF